MLRRLFGNVGLKVLSVALAVLLWYMVAGQKQAERSLRVALEFQNIPEQLELIGEPPSTADIRVRGASGALGQLRSGDLVASMDVASARAGRRMFHLTPEDVTVPTGIRVLSVVPSTVTLMFERSASKVVPVVPQIEGDPAPGFVRGDVHVTPREVEIVGPESIVKSMTEATTEPVVLTNARARVRDVLTIGVLDPVVRLRIPRSAVVTVEVVPAPTERTLTGVPVSVRGSDGGRRTARVTPDTVAVRVRGAGPTVGQLQPQQVAVYVDVSGRRPGTYNLPVQPAAGGLVSVVSIQPESVRVTVK
jgi:YbbR domain-containing protein